MRGKGNSRTVDQVILHGHANRRIAGEDEWTGPTIPIFYGQRELIAKGKGVEHRLDLMEARG